MFLMGVNGLHLAQAQFKVDINDENRQVVTPTEQLPDMVPVKDYLHEIGESLNCYFTLEYKDAPHFTLDYSDATETRQPAIIAKLIPNNVNIMTIPLLLSKLRLDLPALSFEQHSKHANIIHVIERSLGERESYFLNRLIDIEYSGNLVACVVRDEEGKNQIVGEGLVPAIAKKYAVKVLSGLPGGDGREAFGDCVTKVRVHATNQTVRNVLTDCIDVPNYNPILWRAVSRVVGGETNIVIQYYGPKSQ